MYNEENKSSHSDKEKALKVDCSVLQRLIIAHQAGKKVNLDEILCHELLPVPIALAEMNGNLRTGPTAKLSQELTGGI